jgi:DNA polymerase (family 10)
MQNAALAQIFDSIADYHELSGENPFKIRAFRRAAEAVANYPEAIEDIAERGELETIEGLGKGTGGIAREFLATGQVRLLEGFKEQFPEGLFELLRVPGLGPKRVAVLFKEAQIGSIEGLKSAIENDRLKGIAGFGPATIKNLQNGLERLAKVSRRLPLSDALNLAQSLEGALSNFEGVQRAMFAGSIRRGCDTAGNVNLVAETGEPEKVIEAFVHLPFVLAIEERHVDGATVRARPGIAVHLKCAPSESFGARLFFETGSLAHIEHARRRAEKLGLELHPNGIFQNGKRVGGDRESEIFELLGVPFIEPELRENRGEWNAAAQGALPQLITQADIRGELHAHSTWSDGRHTIRQMVEAAKARGYEYHVISDHSKALAMAGGLDAKRLREQAKEIAEVQQDFPDIKILRGIECDIMRDGTMDLDDDILHELDIVIASVHSGFNMDEAAQTARMIKALSHPAVDIVAHPTGRVLGVRPGYAVDVPALIEAARETGTAMEINCSERLDLSDEYAFIARERGVLLSIDTDAHSTRMLDNLSFGITTARRAWCEKKDVLNAKSKDELLAWLKRYQQ